MMASGVCIYELACRGIGIIHNNMAIAQQVEQVRKTKRFENGFITEPFVLKPTDTVADVDCIKKVRRHKRSAFAIYMDTTLIVFIHALHKRLMRAS